MKPAEVITGDLPTPIKYFNADINSAYKNLEEIANKKLIAMLPQEFQSDFKEILIGSDEEVHKFVKAADKLAAYIKCIEEIKCGNSEFTKAKILFIKILCPITCPK